MSKKVFGKIYTYRVIIEKDVPGYHGFVPSLPEVHTAGKTIEETRKNLREAIVVHLEALVKAGERIPAEEGIELIETVPLRVRAS